MKRILSWLFPQYCLFCHINANSNTLVCKDCSIRLPWLQETKQNELILFRYQRPISQFITQLKFHQKLIYASLLAHFFIDAIQKNRIYPLPELFLPVPLHINRLRQRGFNQALEIVKPIARYFNIPLDFHSCHRIVHTKPQTELSEKQRRNNVKQAFALACPISEKHIAIFDDVIATGSTVHEIKILLEKHGHQVEIWACAKACIKSKHN